MQNETPRSVMQESGHIFAVSSGVGKTFYIVVNIPANKKSLKVHQNKVGHIVYKIAQSILFTKFKMA